MRATHPLSAVAMESNEERYHQALQAITFPAFEPSLGDGLDAELTTLREALPPVPDGSAALTPEAVLAGLSAREREVEKELGRYYAQRMELLAKANLEARHAFEMLFAHTRLMDSMHRFAFAVACEELPALIRLQVLSGEKELEFKRELLPRKVELLEGSLAQTEVDGEGEPLSASERAYYAQVRENLAREVEETRERIARLEVILPVMRAFRAERDLLERRLVLFARGGYGRAELSFSSDVDTGWAVGTEGMPEGEEVVFQEAVVRVEALLNKAGVQTAHQYFETGEDLSRFTEPETIHTIPSVLEARVILGNPDVLRRLRENFFAVLPYEEFLKKKLDEFQGQPRPTLTEMDVKGDAGGLRSIQVPLWILGVTRRAEGFMTADLVEVARSQGLLSLWESSRLVRALELLYELRNFLGFAERHYYDQEARAGNFRIDDFPANRVTDGVARLYLFRKGRFPTLDRLDAYRLRLASDVRRISAALLERILDRSITHNLGDFVVSVHLGREMITHILTANGEVLANPTALFHTPDAVLRLFAFIARTDYDLSDALKDALAEVVGAPGLAEAAQGDAGTAAQMSRIVGATYAHRALQTMLEINDPLSPGMNTLLGRFIPEYDQIVFLVRDPHTATTPFHQRLMDCVENGHESLQWLKREYPELHALLGPQHVLALKWALLLHGLGRMEGREDDPAHTAERAAEVIARLGYEDDVLEAELRLLIQHFQTMVQLSRTATYFDQAVVEFFETAGRDIVRVILLFLVNRSILLAGAFRFRGDVAYLDRFFAETGRILAEVGGVAEKSRSLELINEYLYRKKEDLQGETRVFQLLQKGLALGLDHAVYAPLRSAAMEAWSRVEPHTAELDALQRDVVVGAREGREHERLVEKLAQQLRYLLGAETIAWLTREEEQVFTWFFTAFPNRYLLATSPQNLAMQIARFADFRSAQVRAEVISGSRGAEEALLIYTRALPQSHSRVAYMLSRKRINLISGKINPVKLSDDEQAYCYYFQITPLAPELRLFPRDLEQMILNEMPPELEPAPQQPAYRTRGMRVDFLGDDGKGYQVARTDGAFARMPAAYHVVRVVLRDAPFLFYKVARAFDLYDVEIRQSLITTIGNQVVDHFYFDEDAYERLRASTFEDRLLSNVRASFV